MATSEAPPVDESSVVVPRVQLLERVKNKAAESVSAVGTNTWLEIVLTNSGRGTSEELMSFMTSQRADF